MGGRKKMCLRPVPHAALLCLGFMVSEATASSALCSAGMIFASNTPGNPQILCESNLCAPSSTTAGSGGFESRGNACRVLMDVPSACAGVAGRSCPLLFFFHGAGGTNQGWANKMLVASPSIHSTGSRAFIGIYPQGVDNQWHTGSQSGAHIESADEMAFITGIVDTLRSNYDWNSRLYAYGISNGAALTNRLAVNSAMGFSGVAAAASQLLLEPPTSGPGPNSRNVPGPSTMPVAYLSLHGEDDALIPPAGGPLTVTSKPGFVLESVRNTTNIFAKLNGCLSTPSATSVEAQIATGPSSAAVSTYTCPGTTPVVGYMVQGGQHSVGEQIKGKSLEALAIEFMAGVEQVHASCDAETYYARGDLSDVQQGAQLKAQLQGLVSEPHHFIPYTHSTRIDTWDALRDLDADIADRSKVQLIYKQTSDFAENQGVSSGWNREHLWPKSFGVGTSGPDTTDLHALRPADWNVNAARSNLVFSWCDASTGCRDMPAHVEADPTTGKDADVFMPPAAVRGDVARALMYMAVRYDGSDAYTERLTLSDCPCHLTFTMGFLSVLLQWHQLDPPSGDEMSRNDRLCRRYQGNRNPFVDKPELAARVFEGGDAASSSCPPCEAGGEQGEGEGGSALMSNIVNEWTYDPTERDFTAVDSSVFECQAGADMFPNKSTIAYANFSVNYHKSYKIVHNRAANLRYLLYQRGCPPPPDSGDTAAANFAGVFQVPLRSVAVVASSSGLIASLEQVGERPALRLYTSVGGGARDGEAETMGSQSPCLHKQGQDGWTIARDASVVWDASNGYHRQSSGTISVDIEANKLHVEATFVSSHVLTGLKRPHRDVDMGKMKKPIVVSDGQESTFYAAGDWTTFLAVFFNRETEAAALRDGVRERYVCEAKNQALLIERAARKPKVLFVNWWNQTYGSGVHRGWEVEACYRCSDGSFPTHLDDFDGGSWKCDPNAHNAGEGGGAGGLSAVALEAAEGHRFCALITAAGGEVLNQHALSDVSQSAALDSSVPDKSDAISPWPTGPSTGPTGTGSKSGYSHTQLTEVAKDADIIIVKSALCSCQWDSVQPPCTSAQCSAYYQNHVMPHLSGIKAAAKKQIYDVYASLDPEGGSGYLTGPSQFADVLLADFAQVVLADVNATNKSPTLRFLRAGMVSETWGDLFECEDPGAPGVGCRPTGAGLASRCTEPLTGVPLVGTECSLLEPSKIPQYLSAICPDPLFEGIMTKDWGRPGYSHCEQPFSWRELVSGYQNMKIPFKSGGLGRLMEVGGYETWVCIRDHFCGDPWFCWVYHEGRKLFSPWGPNSVLKLVKTA